MKPSFIQAPPAYSQDNEQQFRAQIERMFARMTAGRDTFILENMAAKLRTLDVAAATDAEVRQVLATLINDLKEKQII